MKIIGHRGAKGLAAENTLHSFDKALEHSVDMIELDVRMTKDGKAALAHDPFVTDQAGGKLTIADHTFSELLRHKPELTTLEATLDHINRRVPVIVEIKPSVDPSHTIATLQAALANGWPTTHLIVSSFDQTILRKVHATIPELTLIVNESWSGTRAVRRARELGTKRLAMRSWWLWQGFLAPMHHHGWQITPYTINNPKLARKWQKYLYGIYTDYPDRFKQRSV